MTSRMGNIMTKGNEMQLKENDFREFLEIIRKVDSDPYNPKFYVHKRTMNGFCFEKESSFTFSCLLGMAYAEGHMGEIGFRLFYRNHQGFQLYTKPIDGVFSDRCTSYPPHAVEDLFTRLFTQVTMGLTGADEEAQREH